jgi:hypothetical protein
MGNCNSQRLAESLGDKCGSADQAGATKRRRRRLMRMKDGRHSASTSSSSSSSSSSSATATAQTNSVRTAGNSASSSGGDNNHNNKRSANNSNANEMKTNANDQVKVIDLGSDLADGPAAGRESQTQSAAGAEGAAGSKPAAAADGPRDQQADRLQRLKGEFKGAPESAL